ncbi:MAG: hypothetical protein RMY31_001405 [Dendronalium sp. ChiSLP03b]|nr:hypothetical protein [Dendronalium sp. ChiSLP03b]MDZ8204027.1 hypothetical protein [Dendronalium sp. ChiSLP03b]
MSMWSPCGRTSGGQGRNSPSGGVLSRRCCLHFRILLDKIFPPMWHNFKLEQFYHHSL